MVTVSMKITKGRVLKKEDLPKYDKLLSLLERTWSANHEWGKPIFQEMFIDLRNRVVVLIKRVCKECESERLKLYVFIDQERVKGYYGDVSYWSGYEGKISHSLNYKKSACFKRYKGRHRNHSRRKFRCEICGVTHRTEGDVAECLAKCKQHGKKVSWKEDQINQNIIIIKELGTRAKGRNKLRFKLAIYRLYRYCDFSPKEIARRIYSPKCHLTEDRIRYIIGDVFKMLCQSDFSCVFRKYFEV